MPIANYQLHMPPYRRLGVQARRSLFLLRHPPLQPLYSFPAPKPSSPKTSPFSFWYCCLLQVGALESFTRLEHLNMTGCIRMTSLALNLPYLQALSLQACSALTQVDPSLADLLNSHNCQWWAACDVALHNPRLDSCPGSPAAGRVSCDTLYL